MGEDMNTCIGPKELAFKREHRACSHGEKGSSSALAGGQCASHKMEDKFDQSRTWCQRN